MTTDIDQPVEVVAVFKNNLVFPKLLKWQNRSYSISKLNMRHQSVRGDTLIHYFSVSDNTNFFKLAFNTRNLQWRLEQVYSEG